MLQINANTTQSRLSLIITCGIKLLESTRPPFG